MKATRRYNWVLNLDRFCAPTPTAGALREQADQQLFTVLKHNPVHPFIDFYQHSVAHHTSPVSVYTTLSSPQKLYRAYWYSQIQFYISDIVYTLFVAFSALYLWIYRTDIVQLFISGMSVNDLIKTNIVIENIL